MSTINASETTTQEATPAIKSTQIETYIPLYRKYRPQSFADVVGQQAIVQTLSNAITTQKVAHAYLLCGPRGTGKTSTARILAKSLNCAKGSSPTPCQECESCQGITIGNALDVVEFDAASNNSVDDARELIESCQFAPMAGRYKIYIIDEVHMLSTSAFNALLKTLEEPPPNVIFIFATTEAHKVLPTIISRCQRFDFTRITTPDIAAQLRRIADQESLNINDEALTTIARHAKGGMRDALGLLDQVGVLSRSQPDKIVEQHDISRFVRALEEDTLLEVCDAIATHAVHPLLTLVQTLINRGVEPIQLIKELTHHFRNLFLIKAAGNDTQGHDEATQADTLGVSVECISKLKTQAEKFALEEFPPIIESLAQSERNIRNTQEAQLWLEVGLLELATRQNIHRISDLITRIEALESGQPLRQAAHQLQPQQQPARQPQATQQLSSQAASPASPRPIAPTATAPPQPQAPVKPPVAAASRQPSSPVQAGSIQPTAGGGGGTTDWPTVIAQVASRMTRALLKDHTFLISLEGNKLTVGCSSEPILQTLNKPDKLLHLQKGCEKHFGRTLSINIIHEAKPKGIGAPAPVSKPEPATATEVPAQTPTQNPTVPLAPVTPLPKNPPTNNPQGVQTLSKEPIQALPPLAPVDKPPMDKPAVKPLPLVQPTEKAAAPQEATSKKPTTAPTTVKPLVQLAPLQPVNPAVNPPVNPPMNQKSQSTRSSPYSNDMPPLEDDPSGEAIPQKDPETPESFETATATPNSEPNPTTSQASQEDTSPPPRQGASEQAKPTARLIPMAKPAPDEDLEEAKTYTKQLLQGRPVE